MAGLPIAPDGSDVTCPGYCCAALSIAETIEEIRADMSDPESGMVADMLIPLTYDEAVARATRFGRPLETVQEFEKGPNTRWYTCRHWDEDTKLCTIWNERPEMCRGYPYEGACKSGCAYRTPPDELARWLAVESKIEARRLRSSEP